MPLPELRTADYVAVYFNVTRDTVLDWAQKGLIKGTKIGKTWHFLEEDIVDFLNGQREALRAARTAPSGRVRRRRAA